MTDCLFCKIIDGKIPAKILAQSDLALAFADITPQAPFHALIVPKKHVSSLNDLDAQGRQILLPELYALADKLAFEKGFRERGYRTVINNQADAGQTVFHLHLHMLGEGKLKGGFGA